MRTLPWVLALFIASLPACKGQPHTTSSGPTPPAADDQPVGPQDEPATPTSPGQEHDLAQQGQPCPEGACKAGMTCLTYYGIAGASGPSFTSCEIPCAEDPSACPTGQQCVMIADGPGNVCRAP